MPKLNPENEMAKRDYLSWRKNTDGWDEPTLDQAAAAICGFEAFNRVKPFKSFRPEQAISFKAHLFDQINAVTGKPLSKATLHSKLRALKSFFEWLSREPGYRKALNYSDAAYFNLPDKDVRVATARREPKTPSIEQVLRVLETMPGDTIIQRRDRALVACIMVTGARVMAVATFQLQHIDMDKGLVTQDARTVKTKRAKTFTSSFFPVGDQARRILGDWLTELRECELFGLDDPIFPASAMALDAGGQFAPSGLSRRPWTTTAPIREIFKRAFSGAGLPYYTPHSLRRTLQNLGYDLELTPRQQKAWSQSFGHSSVNTTLTSYGQLPVSEQARVMAALGTAKPRKAVSRGRLAEIISELHAELVEE